MAMSSPIDDVAVIGGGIVGLATANALVSADVGSVVVLEAEAELALHQTGRNSGVIHSGLYYRPDSDKARFCAAGRDALYRFCEEYGIAHRRCGKLVVAVDEAELPDLERLAQRARANGLEGVERLGPEGIREHEPAAAGVGALWVPATGVVDFAQVAHKLAERFCSRGGRILTSARLRRVTARGDELLLDTDLGSLRCRLMINCAGLQADRVARLCGLQSEIRLVPFRGEYLELREPAAQRVNGLVYPVPDPRLPFLGIHLTRTIDDRVLAGPNAVLAWKREGYRATDFSWRDAADTLSFPGFWRLAGSFWRTGAGEMARSWNRSAFLAGLQRLLPGVRADDLRPARSGVRAQAIDRRGTLLDDFQILYGDRMVHVINAPSPAATAALAIGRHLADLASDSLC
jgi:L-2-hydroxyglutarate oxidase